MLAAGSLTGRSLLGVFAHPDDESLACGGLLAWCAELGARVSLLCLTGGEGGPGGSTAEAEGLSLRDARARELDAAARVLGVAEVTLRDHGDGLLPWVDAVTLESDIRDAIHRSRPEVVITFGADGLYWHPDHIAVHERTTSAVTALGEDAPALFYVTIPPGLMRAVVGAVTAGMKDEAGTDVILGVADPDAFGACAEGPTLVLDVGPFAVRKLAALKCHRTQLGQGPFALVKNCDAARLLGTEYLHRASAGARGGAFIEDLVAP